MRELLVRYFFSEEREPVTSEGEQIVPLQFMPVPDASDNDGVVRPETRSLQDNYAAIPPREGCPGINVTLPKLGMTAGVAQAQVERAEALELMACTPP